MNVIIHYNNGNKEIEIEMKVINCYLSSLTLSTLLLFPSPSFPFLLSRSLTSIY